MTCPIVAQRYTDVDQHPGEIAQPRRCAQTGAGRSELGFGAPKRSSQFAEASNQVELRSSLEIVNPVVAAAGWDLCSWSSRLQLLFHFELGILDTTIRIQHFMIFLYDPTTFVPADYSASVFEIVDRLVRQSEPLQTFLATRRIHVPNADHLELNGNLFVVTGFPPQGGMI